MTGQNFLRPSVTGKRTKSESASGSFSQMHAPAPPKRRRLNSSFCGTTEMSNDFDNRDGGFAFGLTAADVLNLYSEADLHKIFGLYGEIKNAKTLAKAIVTARFEKEALFMKNRWKYFIEDDPHYNPNLSLKGGYRIDLERAKKWPWQMNCV